MQSQGYQKALEKDMTPPAKWPMYGMSAAEWRKVNQVFVNQIQD
jgi:hypothetical protein